MSKYAYEMTKEMTNSKIKATAKSEIISVIRGALINYFGEDSVKMVRVGSTSKSNEIGVRMATVDKDGESLELIATINASIKEFENRQTAKKSYTAFDFESAAREYENYCNEKGTTKKSTKVAKPKDTIDNSSEVDEVVPF